MPREKHASAHNSVLPYAIAALKTGGRVDLSVLPNPYALASLLPGNLRPYPPSEHVDLGLPIGLQRPYVQPIKLPLVPYKPLLAD